MKLYELYHGDEFTLDDSPVTQPPDIWQQPDPKKVYRLKNIDGMYSYVTDIEGNVYHFAAWTEVEKVK